MVIAGDLLKFSNDREKSSKMLHSSGWERSFKYIKPHIQVHDSHNRVALSFYLTFSSIFSSLFGVLGATQVRQPMQPVGQVALLRYSSVRFGQWSIESMGSLQLKELFKGRWIIPLQFTSCWISKLIFPCFLVKSPYITFLCSWSKTNYLILGCMFCSV